MELREIKMTALQVLDLKGNKVSELTLNDEVFAIEPSVGAVHTALVRQLANSRSGSANTKTRAEVRGGGAKPWRQKGTGRARAGSKRSPLWEGGGVIFGPKPRDYSFAMPRKMRIVALKSALTEKRDNLIIVRDFNDLKEAKTKEAVQVLKNLEISNRKVLIVLDYSSEHSSRFALAARNLPNVKVIHVTNLNVKDLLHAKSVLTTESAIEIMTNWLKPGPKPENGESTKKPKRSKLAKESAKSTSTATKPPKAKAADTATSPKAKTAEKAKASAAAETKATKPTESKVTAAKEKSAKSTKEHNVEEVKAEKKTKTKEESEAKPKRKSTKE
jgi:large subunit ribosomal protein L4